MHGKRMLDLVVASFGLLVLSPLFLAIAVWIRLDSAGPAFFRQDRVGRGGGTFRIHKFRTMRQGVAGQGPAITVGADARVTRAGVFLRHSKLDELPQLIDVVRGDMSLVGPRPEVPLYVAMYPEDVRRMVLSIRPGITDLASLMYRNESELLGQAADAERHYRDVMMPAKLRLAILYVETNSVLGDLRLIGCTLRALVRRSDA